MSIARSLLLTLALATAAIATPREDAVNVLNDTTLSAEKKVERLRAMANKNEESGDVWAAYADSLEKAGNDAQALAAYQKAIALDGALATPWFQVGLLLKRGVPKPDYVGAEDAFRKALERGAPKARTMNELGVALALQKKNDAAIEAFRGAVEADPQWGVAYNNLTKALLQAGDTSAAEELVPATIAAERFDETALLMLGEKYRVQKKLKAAIALYERGVAKHPNNARLHYYLGLAQADNGNTDAAIKSFTSAQTAASLMTEGTDVGIAGSTEIFRLKNPKVHAQFAEVQPLVTTPPANASERDRNMKQAIKKLGPMIEAHPDFWNARFVRGMAYRRSGDNAKALADFEAVLAIVPREPNSLMERALALRDERRFKEAADSADLACEIGKRDPLFAINGGLIMLEDKRCDRAWELYRRAVRMVGEDAAAVLRVELDVRCPAAGK